MKKCILILAFFMISVEPVISQAPPPPPASANNGGANGPISAPIDGGLTVFLTFAAGYAAWEWNRRKPAGK